MSTRVIAVAIDCADPETLAEFWCHALGYTVTERWADSRGCRYVEAGARRPTLEELRSGPVEPVLLFQPVAEEKTGKNRLHLDIAPVEHGQQEEVRRLIGLGATQVADEPDLPWVVLTDPEGNEFCVLRTRANVV
jgi:hypothetical protein